MRYSTSSPTFSNRRCFLFATPLRIRQSCIFSAAVCLSLRHGASAGHGWWRRPPDIEYIKLIPFKAWTEPYTSRSLGLPEFLDYQQMKVVRLSALRSGRLYPTADKPGTHFCQSRPQGHSAAGRFMSMKICNDTIGNRTRNLQACSAVPQQTAPRRKLRHGA